MAWPSHFPADCPPADATQPAGTFYRLVPAMPPAATDLDSQYVKFPDRKYSDPCKARGVSMYAMQADAVSTRDRYHAFRSWLVAVGSVDGAPGLVKATPSNEGSSHHTWWLPSDVDQQALADRFCGVVAG
jgi:hypothetical protein